MQCPHCGAENNKESEKCVSCGRFLLEDAPSDQKSAEVIARITGGRSWGKIIAGVVILCAVLIFGYIELVFDPYGQPPEWAYYASAQNSLRYMQAAQEEHFIETGEYACEMEQLEPFFQPDPAVVHLILKCGKSSWMAAACPENYPAIFISDTESGGLRNTKTIYRSGWFYFFRKFSLIGPDDARREVREELRKITDAQEHYRDQNGKYASSVSSLSRWYEPGSNLTVLVADATAEEFIIVGTHNKLVSLMAYDSRNGYLE